MRTNWEQHPAHDGVAVRYFDDDGKIVRHRVQDVEPIIKHNQRVRNEVNGRTKGGGRKVGSVPVTVFYEWVKEWTARGLVSPGDTAMINQLAIKRLRDGDFSKFRTTDGGI